ncbi:MAG: metallophosphoesterase family protein [Lachnospiraceae bacterium]|nr:metallophosphoesterase family protein [Lachnospiraceae bacterium]
MKKTNLLRQFAAVLLTATVIITGCGCGKKNAEAPAESKTEETVVENVYEVGSKVTCAGYSGTITGMVKMDNDNFFEESGSLLFDSVNSDGDVVFITDDNDDNVRVRCLFQEGEGVKVKEGDYLVFKYEPKNDFPFRTLYIEGVIDDPEGWDSLYIGDMNYTDGFALMEISEDFFDQNLSCLRIKGDGAPAGTELDFSQVFVMTDVTAPIAKTYSYEISDTVHGVSTTFYNDVYSRGVAWRTVDVEGADTGLQYVDKKEVKDIYTYDWDKGIESGKVITVPDYFNTAIENSDESATYYCHKAHVENLPEGSEYYYRVGGESTGYSRPGLWTIKGDLDDFFFIYVTDPQAENESQYRQYEALMREAFKTAGGIDSTLVGYINTGDITNECHDDNYFIDEYNMAADFDAEDMMDTVILPLAGNHDNSVDGFYSMFDIDFANYCTDGKHNPHSSGGCSSIQIGNAYVITTNSNESAHLDGAGNGEYDPHCDYREQYAWIVSELENAQKLREEGKIKWIIVTTHAGMMSVGYHTMDGGSRALRENLVPLFAKYSVDLVLQGHDHAYTRTNPYYYGKDVNGNFFTGYVSNERETGEGYGEITKDDPFTKEVETEGRNFNLEPEGTHYVTINYSGEKSLDISKENAESRYAVPDEYIEEGCATSVINEELCGKRVRKQFYAIVRFKGDVLNFDTYSYNGINSELYDTFMVKKDGSCVPDIAKRDIDFEGVYAFDKAYDGDTAEMDVFDITAYKRGTADVEKLFKEYDDIEYTVTGKTADGKDYNSDKMPSEAGKYTLHAKVSDDSIFFKGETTVDFEITK